MSSRLIVIAILLTLAISGNAQIIDSVNRKNLIFELPLIDLPYQNYAAKTVGDGSVTFGTFLKGYANPGMHLSLSLTADLYTISHWGIKELFYPVRNSFWKDRNNKRKFWYGVTLTGFDLFSFYAPGFDGWQHEEYHRAVLTRFRINSFNDMNKFPIGAEYVNVSHVKDEDLVRFKQESPTDLVRAHAAGIEGEYLLTDRLQRNNFYYSQEIPHEVLYIVATLNSIFYVKTCSNPKEADKITDEANAEEIPVESRDFTGLDFLAWTYDIFRPDEPYTARGIHPSGTGIDRYIKTTDLTHEELTYLKRQGNLQFLNMVNPMIFGLRRIKLNENGLYGNFSIHNFLTSFGNDISCNILLMNQLHKYYFVFHSYQNYKGSYPAFEAQLIDHELPFFSGSLYISPRLLAGIQPWNQEFMETRSEFLGLAECRFELRTKNYLSMFAEFSAKTDGWVAGNEFLNSNFSVRFGLVSRIQVKR